MTSSDRIIRAPNHLGDLVMALPGLVADGADVMVVRSLAPLLEMAGLAGRILPLDRGLAGFTRAVRALRRGGYQSGVLLSAAFSAAWLFRWGGVRELRGTRTDGRGWLLREPIDPERLRGRHRTRAFGLLLGQERGDGPGGRPGDGPGAVRRAGRRGGPPGAPLLVPPEERVRAWRSRLPPGPLVGLFPGANAPARRWPIERFAEVAATLLASGRGVVALGGPAERELTAALAQGGAHVADLGGETDLVDLAAILSLCDLVVTNDTGPMHLAGAVGTPTVSLWGSSDPEEVGQVGSMDRRVAGAELPCAPCRRNHCHRRGRGTLLPDAHVECMRLIDVEDVVAAVEAALGRRPGDA